MVSGKQGGAEALVAAKKAETFHIPSLDGIRALSFGVVFLSHAGVDAVPGGFGVTVFFFLSGFLITSLMRREVEQTSHVSLKNFYIRRVLRILPPFYLVLGLSVALSAFGLTDGSFKARALMAQALHYANYWIAFHGFDGFPAGTGVYWSLAVEEHFYLLFPWLYLALQRLGASRSAQQKALLGLCALLLLWRCVLVFGLHVSSDRVFVASDTRFDSIIFGCALAIGENPVFDKSAISESVWKRVLFPLGLVALLLTFALRNPVFRDTLRYTIQGMALVPIFVCAMRYPSWLPMRPLNLPAVGYLGLLSYTLYLVHQVMLALVSHAGPNLGLVPRGAAALGLSVVIAFAMYELVEKPCARLRRRLHAQAAN
jgi:peptidoglycan/LPS O-acetylase OafA/YrhL